MEVLLPILFIIDDIGVLASRGEEHTDVNALLLQQSFLQVLGVEQQGPAVPAVTREHGFEILSVVNVFHLFLLTKINLPLLRNKLV